MGLLRIALFTLAVAGCSSNDEYCSTRSCPNDAPRTTAEIKLCKDELDTKCNGDYRNWQDCLRKRDVCTNGALDPVKQQAALDSCGTLKATLDFCLKKL